MEIFHFIFPPDWPRLCGLLKVKCHEGKIMSWQVYLVRVYLWTLFANVISETDMTQCLQREKDNLINVLIEGSFLSCIKLTVSIGYFLFDCQSTYFMAPRSVMIYFRIMQRHYFHCASHSTTFTRYICWSLCDHVVIGCLYIINKLIDIRRSKSH